MPMDPGGEVVLNGHSLTSPALDFELQTGTRNKEGPGYMHQRIQQVRLAR